MRTIGLPAALMLASCVHAPHVEVRIDSVEIDRAVTLRPADKEELTLEYALELAHFGNPQLGIERRNIDLAEAALWEARLYPNPSLLLQTEDYRTKDKSTIGKMERTVGASFPVVVGGRIGAAASVAEKEREIAAINYVWRRREILTDVRKAFISVLASQRNVELAREAHDLARSLHDATGERFKAEAVPEMELLKAAVGMAKAEIDLKTAEREAASAIDRLKALMGFPDGHWKKFSGNLAAKLSAPDLESLRGQALSSHPLLQSAEKSLEAAERRVALARAGRFPDTSIELTVGRNPEDETIVEGGVTVPLPIFQRNQAAIMAAEIRVRQANFQIRSVIGDLMLRLNEAHRNLTAAQDLVRIYNDDILPKAEKASAQTDEGYRLGKFSFLDVLDARRTLTEAKAAAADAVMELNLAAAELAKISGVELMPDE